MTRYARSRLHDEVAAYLAFWQIAEEPNFGHCEECGTFGVDTDYRGADGRSVCDDCRDAAEPDPWAYLRRCIAVLNGGADV